MKSFIDCHCHGFNLVDVPMYLTISDKVKMGTFQRLKVAFLGTMGSIVNLFHKDLAADLLGNQKEFISFFERSAKRNIQMILEQIKEQNQDDPDNQETLILITPLIMDFDILLELEMPEQVGKEPSVKEQYYRLVEAISSYTIQNISHTKVCPFVGFDLRKLLKANDDKLEGFIEFWERSNTLGIESIEELESGKLLGIKLYPPIGFNPCPNTTLPQNYERFYKFCIEQDIPITTHCQKESFTAGKEKTKADKNTHPKNWKRLLSLEGMDTLRINFAHFGGESELSKMFQLNILDEITINRTSWSYIIIKLLKKYPNTYADISAYDYSKEEFRNNLAKVFKYDEDGEFGSGYKLKEKLLWGSDIPMVISHKSYKKDYQSDGESKYKHYFNGFTTAINELPNKEEIIKNLTDVNPKKFLRVR